MTQVFMPINLRMEQLITEHAHLIEGTKMPKPFLDLISHVEVYKIILKKWENKDFNQHVSYINFPDSFEVLIKGDYKMLKKRQFDLLDKINP